MIFSFAILSLSGFNARWLLNETAFASSLISAFYYQGTAVVAFQVSLGRGYQKNNETSSILFQAAAK